MIGTISNYKGGTGKTVTSVNLGATLSALDKKILIVDIDPQSDASRALLDPGTDIDECMFHLLHPDIRGDVDVVDTIYPTIHENLFIIPNISESSGLEIPLSVAFPDSNFFLRESIYDYVTEHFDFVLIDCPPTLSVFVANALYASDFVLIPMLAGSGNSLEGINGVLKLMTDVQGNGNERLRFLKILINKVDKRKKAHKANVETAKKRFGMENIFKTSIPTSGVFETLETLPGHSILSWRSRSHAMNGARAFKEIAKEFLEFFEDESTSNR